MPISAPIRRGILVSIPLPGAEIAQYKKFYAGNPLVNVSDQPPDLLSVTGTPLTQVSVVRPRDGNGDHAVVFSVIDNLGRGAASQAIANVNLLMGWPVDLGLQALGALV